MYEVLLSSSSSVTNSNPTITPGIKLKEKVILNPKQCLKRQYQTRSCRPEHYYLHI